MSVIWHPPLHNVQWAVQAMATPLTASCPKSRVWPLVAPWPGAPQSPAQAVREVRIGHQWLASLLFMCNACTHKPCPARVLSTVLAWLCPTSSMSIPKNQTQPKVAHSHISSVLTCSRPTLSCVPCCVLAAYTQSAPPTPTQPYYLLGAPGTAPTRPPSWVTAPAAVG